MGTTGGSPVIVEKGNKMQTLILERETILSGGEVMSYICKLQ